MDVVGGKGICMGPSNFLGAAYMQIPVAITVEGANILTRSLIVFGQGAIRCHPYVLKEIEATREADREKASIAFDAALFGHLRFALSNLARTLVMGLTGSHFVGVPAERRAGNAPLLPAAHALLGGARVPRRRVDGHAGRRAEAQGEALGAAGRHPVAHVPLLGDAEALRGRRPAAGRRAADALGDVGRDVQGAERVRGRDLELPEPVHRRGDAPRRVPARPARTSCRRTSSGHDVARLLIEPSATRDRLTAGMYLAARGGRSAGADRARARGDARRRADRGASCAPRSKEGRVDAKLPPGAGVEALVARAQAAGVITAAEAAALVAARELTAKVIRVDDFAQDLGASEMRPRADRARRRRSRRA